MLKSRLPSAVQICVKKAGETVFSEAYGNIGWDGQYFPANPLTLFDFSDLTQVFTAAALMRLVDYEIIQVDDPVCAVLREFSGPRPVQSSGMPAETGSLAAPAFPNSETADAAGITFRQLLRHSSGIQSRQKLYQQKSPCSAKHSLLGSGFQFMPDSDVQPSDSAYMLIGWAIETLCKTDLSTAMDQLVLKPLNLTDISFRPLDPQQNVPLPLPEEGIAPTLDSVWRHRRLRGEVYDRNSAFFGGVCGHAGLFGTADELAAFGEAFLSGSDFLKAESLFAMTHIQTAETGDGAPFGLGFQLWSADPAGSFAPLSSESFGFAGSNGIHLLIDPMRDLVIAFLTNESMNGGGTLLINALYPKMIRSILRSL